MRVNLMKVAIGTVVHVLAFHLHCVVIIQHQNHVEKILLVIGLLILVWKIALFVLILQNVIRAAVVIGIIIIPVKMNHHQIHLHYAISIPQNSHVKEILIVIIVLVQIVPFLSVLKNVQLVSFLLVVIRV
jgi:hypothetical protein